MTEIHPAHSGSALASVRELWLEYWTALGLPMEFQGFAEQWRNLPGEFAPPAGALLLALTDGQPAGTIALRPLSAQACELKRLYVRPAHRGQGIAVHLLAAAIQEARQQNYAEIFADTLPSMTEAAQLYQKAGFVQVSPYSDHPTEGAIYLRLMLKR